MDKEQAKKEFMAMLDEAKEGTANSTLTPKSLTFLFCILISE